MHVLYGTGKMRRRGAASVTTTRCKAEYHSHVGIPLWCANHTRLFLKIVEKEMQTGFAMVELELDLCTARV